MIQVAILAIIAAIAVPALVKWKFNAHRDCLRQLVRLDGNVAAGTELPVCPVTEEPYRKKTKTTGEGEAAVTTVRWRCPDAEQHLGSDHVLVVQDGVAVPHAEYPPLERVDGGPEVAEGLWSSYTELHTDGQAQVVRQWAGGFSWFLAWVLLVIGAGAAIGFVVVLVGRLAGQPPSPDSPLGCLFVLAIALLLGSHYALGERVATFTRGPKGPVVTLQNTYWVFDGGVTTIASPEIIWSPPGGTFAEILYTDDEGEPVHTRLFNLDPGTPALMGPLHEALYGPGTVHRPKPAAGK